MFSLLKTSDIYFFKVIFRASSVLVIFPLESNIFIKTFYITLVLLIVSSKIIIFFYLDIPQTVSNLTRSNFQSLFLRVVTNIIYISVSICCIIEIIRNKKQWRYFFKKIAALNDVFTKKVNAVHVIKVILVFAFWTPAIVELLRQTLIHLTIYIFIFNVFILVCSLQILFFTFLTCEVCHILGNRYTLLDIFLQNTWISQKLQNRNVLSDQLRKAKRYLSTLHKTITIFNFLVGKFNFFIIVIAFLSSLVLLSRILYMTDITNINFNGFVYYNIVLNVSI